MLSSPRVTIPALQSWTNNTINNMYNFDFNNFDAQLKNNKNLIDSKKIIFTESKETAEYLKIELQKALKQPITVFTGSSHNSLKEVIRANYDPNYDPKKQKKDFDILITTDVLAEGINLHRASVLINYDLH